VLTVADDGIGVAKQALQRAGSFGLMGLRERAHMLGGQIEVGRRPRGGTRLTVRVPAHPASSDAGS
jgi:signal transduction histidine kinase